ncbi:hypothetical protein BFF78_12045 [Streptomyces fodineus]|uniref:Uncharacterized protein n=1 Tax=Streptomyces fodineus TaxID=1904616 RepID=A0A1D7Y856_9ACTN|nr:hypothetical protein BFF78_12045 [Streptomyces fodineus]
MVEGEWCHGFAVAAVTTLLEQFLDRCPARVAGITSRAWGGQVGRERKVGDTHHTHARVPLGVTVGGELFEVGSVVLGRGRGVVCAQPRLLGKLARRRLGEILVGPYETAGQRPAPLERRLAPADRQRAQGMAAHGQHDQVHGDGEGRKG